MSSRLIILSCVLFTLVSSRTVKIKNLQRLDEPAANGSPDFNYVNEETTVASNTLKQFLTDAQAALDQHVQALKTSNDASVVLKEYEEAASSAAGTSCEVTTEFKNKFNGAQENIEATVETCAAFVPKDGFDSLNKTITGDLVEVQTIDNTIRLNQQICFSLRVPPSSNCQKALKKALHRLKNVMCEEELENLTTLSRQAAEAAKSSVDQCVRDDTKSLRDDIVESVKAISDCQAGTS